MLKAAQSGPVSSLKGLQFSAATLASQPPLSTLMSKKMGHGVLSYMSRITGPGQEAGEIYVPTHYCE